jgi:diguanylate cyclase (GGDEF)-like protein
MLAPQRRNGNSLIGVSRTSRRLVIIGAVTVAAIASSTAWLISVQHTSGLAESRRATTNLAQVLAEQTSRSISPVDLGLRQIQGWLESAGPQTLDAFNQSLGSRAMFDLLSDQMRGLPQADALVVIGPNGRLLNTSRIFPAPPLDLSDRELYQYFSTHDDHGVFVTAPVKTLIQGIWTVYLSRRITGPQGEFAGIVAAAFTLTDLEDFYTAVTPEHGTVTVLRRDGIVLVHYPHDERQIGWKLPAEVPWYQYLGVAGGSYRSPGYMNNLARLVSVRPLREFPLVVNVSTSERAALSSWRRQTLWLLTGALFAATCVIFLLRVFGTQFNRLEQSEASLARQNAQLESGRQQFDAVLDNMSQGLTFFDRDQKLIVCNRRFGEIYRLSPDQTAIGTSLLDIINHRLARGSFPDMTRADYLARREALSRAGKPYDVTDEFRNGRIVSMHYQPMPNEGWVTTHEDITEKRQAEARLVFMARHDALTELPNRTLFQERMASAIAMTRLGAESALLCLDLDGFKVVNDTLGHPAGDRLLRAVAERLSGAVREVDTVARLGGDEFAIVQVGLASPEQAAILADRIIKLIRQPFDLDGRRAVVGVSIGISMAPSDGTSIEMLLRNADIALYLAKIEGRGTYRFFESEMDARVHGRRVLELDLRNAVPARDFALHYQPFLDLQSGRVTGFEALARWHHPIRGLIDPVEFIPIAEETGLIVSIGEWVLRTACLEAAHWPPDIGLAVNLSPAQLKGDHLLEVVKEALASSGLAPTRLELEITESVLLQKTDESLALLHQLRALGIRFALDDFGTGYSSLSYLRGFPFDKIKIDQSFIHDVDTNNDSTVIVGAIIGLARGLGMTVTAEGVETEEQRATLRKHGCTEVQGHLFSRPLPGDEVPGFIQTLRAFGRVDYGERR